MQMVVFIATQKSHSGLSTCRVKSVGKHVGTAGLNSRNKSQQEKTAVSMSEPRNETPFRRQRSKENKRVRWSYRQQKSGVFWSPGAETQLLLLEGPLISPTTQPDSIYSILSHLMHDWFNQNSSNEDRYLRRDLSGPLGEWHELTMFLFCFLSPLKSILPTDSFN